MLLLHHQLVACFKEMSCGDIITTFLGGLLGFLGAYIMFRIQRNSDRDAEAQKEAAMHRGTFQFAKEQLTRATKAWGRNQKTLGAFGAKYGQDPYNDHPHPVNVNPAQRSLDSIDRKELRMALGHHFGSKGGERVFRSLVAIIDYFSTHADKTHEGIIAIQQDIYNEKIRFDDLHAELGMTIANTMAALRAAFGPAHPLHMDLNNILGGLHAHINGPNFQGTPKEFMDHMVTPALALVKNQSYAPADLANILSAAKRAQQSFHRIKQSAGHLVELAERTADAIDWMMRLVRKVLEVLSRPEQTVNH